jgi:putative aminopeptidase FrvX
MRPESLEFFKEIVNTPSPSGYEERAAEVYRAYAAPFTDKVHTDVHGNVWAVLNPNASMKVMLAGHMDEIGFIVHYISDEGLLYFSGIGGHDSVIPVGQRVWVHGKARVPGVIGRKAIHLLEEDERKCGQKMSIPARRCHFEPVVIPDGSARSARYISPLNEFHSERFSMISSG